MALNVTGQRQAFTGTAPVAACAVAPVVAAADVSNAKSLINQIEESGKQRGALIVIKASGGALSLALANGVNATDTWTPFTMDAAITPATVATLAFTTDLPATKSVAVGAALNLTVAVTGGYSPYTYTWTKDGTTVGSNAATYNVAAAATGNAGKYKVVVKDASGATITSKECTVTVA